MVWEVVIQVFAARKDTRQAQKRVTRHHIFEDPKSCLSSAMPSMLAMICSLLFPMLAHVRAVQNARELSLQELVRMGERWQRTTEVVRKETKEI